MVNTQTKEILRAVAAYYDGRMSLEALGFVAASYGPVLFKSLLLPQSVFVEVMDFISSEADAVVDGAQNSARISPVESADSASGPAISLWLS
jgi:hypothetical protein